jgi:hypothetical protein
MLKVSNWLWDDRFLKGCRIAMFFRAQVFGFRFKVQCFQMFKVSNWLYDYRFLTGFGIAVFCFRAQVFGEKIR